MESFYGGKQGRTFKIVAHFDSVYDMVAAFQKGGSYTDVNFDEYVIVDTIFRKNQKNNAENGLLYRRGYDFSEEFNPHQVPLDEIASLQPNQLTETTIRLYANTYGIEYTEGQLTSGTYSANVKVPKYWSYTYKFNNPNSSNRLVDITATAGTFKTEKWNDDWSTFVTHPGGGAVYVGQIVGPEGDSPALEIIDWNALESYAEDKVVVKGSTSVISNPGYVNGTPRDDIKYAYCNIEDAQGNITGCYIAFDIPYTVFKFDGEPVSPYVSRQWDSINNKWIYPDLIQEEADSVDHNYYKHYTIHIPQGIHGQDINSLEIVTDVDSSHPGKWLAYRTKNYDLQEDPSPSNAIPLSAYRVISSIDPIKNQNQYKKNNIISNYSYPYQIKMNFTQGNASTYEVKSIEDIWYQLNDDSNFGLQKGYIYAQMSNGETVNLGPTAQLDSIAFDGDLFLIRFSNYTGSEQNYQYQGKTWINLGSYLNGSHILTNFTTLSALQNAYPNGMSSGYKGWLATVGSSNTNKKLYAYDYRTNSGWYLVKDLDSGLIDPENSVLLSKIDSATEGPINDFLNTNGLWFVVVE